MLAGVAGQQNLSRAAHLNKLGRETVEGGADTDTTQKPKAAGKKRERKSTAEEPRTAPPLADRQRQETSGAKSAVAAPASVAISKRATRSIASADNTQERGRGKRRKLQGRATAPEVKEQPEARQGQPAEGDLKGRSKKQLNRSGADRPLGQTAAPQTAHRHHKAAVLQGHQHLESGPIVPAARSSSVSTSEQSGGDCSATCQSSDEASSVGVTSDDESDEDYVPEGVCKGESRLKQEQSSALSPGKFQTGEWAGRKPKRRKHGKPSALIKVLGLMRCRPKNAEAPDSNLYKEGKFRGVERSARQPTWRAVVIIGTCNGRRNRIFVSTAYRTAEAAAVGYDRAAIAVFGRDMAVLNNPLADYPPEVNFRRSGPDLEQFIMELREQAASDALKAGPVASEYASRLHKLRQAAQESRQQRRAEAREVRLRGKAAAQELWLKRKAETREARLKRRAEARAARLERIAEAEQRRLERRQSKNVTAPGEAAPTACRRCGECDVCITGSGRACLKNAATARRLPPPLGSDAGRPTSKPKAETMQRRGRALYKEQERARAAAAKLRGSYVPAVDESQEAEQPFTRADPTFHPSGATVEEGCSTVTTYDYAADFARLRRCQSSHRGYEFRPPGRSLGCGRCGSMQHNGKHCPLLLYGEEQWPQEDDSGTPLQPPSCLPSAAAGPAWMSKLEPRVSLGVTALMGAGEDRANAMAIGRRRNTHKGRNITPEAALAASLILDEVAKVPR